MTCNARVCAMRRSTVMAFRTDVITELPQEIPLHRIREIIPSSRRGKKLALGTLYRWKSSGRLHTIKIGGSLYVTLEDLTKLLRSAPSGLDGNVVELPSRAQRAAIELDRLLKKGA